MKKLEQHFKKYRNDTDIQVKKYKNDLNVIGIRYDHKFAHVAVPNHATGGFEYFKWDWMTSITGSHSEIVTRFKKIVSILKEAKSNPAQYENLVSNLDASTKNALEVTIKSNNITIPTQDTNKVMSEILSGMQTWLDTKSHIPMDLKQKFLDLGSNHLELFIKAAYNKFNNTWLVKEFVDNAVKTGEEGRKYLADCDCSSTDQLWTKLVEPIIENLRISENSTDKSEDDEISEASANKLGAKVKTLALSNTHELPAQKEALKLVYDMRKGNIDKATVVKNINFFGQDDTLLGWFVEYSGLTIDQIKAKAVEITGDDADFYLE
ncbi:hypothetical protein [Rickettsia japonica]|uniref:Uncharacterized protein n=2 Tax=Rickettsia japonica TaxID=35790 RepID=A0AAD1CBC1_RICJA|nr:hypothetical protein [Rickettsia japonica]AXU06473.1 hypothetical protein D0Z68_03220 [Rickettsia japonica]QHE25145.1 hypothetical protein GRX81_05535 [Rickettsia japonica]BAK96646.1 hypothetical protein RJP_0432 [Rickettsia japonica YH]BAW82738.1 predicted protein [Rickettsia japonica]